MMVHDPSSHTDSAGVPEGHPPITGFLGAPLKEGGRTFGMIALANKKTHYTTSDRKAVEDLSISFVETLMRHRAESRLRRYRKAVESSRELIAVVDRKYRYQLVNHAFLAQWKSKRELIIGRSVEEVLGREVFEHTVRSHLDACFKGEDVSFEMQREYPEMGVRDLEVNYFPIRDDGGVTQIVAVMRDVTEQKLLEARLRQSQKMEAVGRLAGGVAHDFNSLLTSIIGFSDVVKMKMGRDNPLCEYMEEIRKARDKAAALTRQLLAFSRKETVQPRVVDLNFRITDALKMLERLIGDDVRMVTRLDPDLWKVKIDPGQVDQMVMNLVVNAGDAMPTGGTLTLETANKDLATFFIDREAEQRPKRYVILVVSDTGMGMDEETLSHIFEPFFTTKGIGKGTGLGLSTVYGVVKQNNGFIRPVSEEGKGTTFNIYLPAVEEEKLIVNS